MPRTKLRSLTIIEIIVNLKKKPNIYGPYCVHEAMLRTLFALSRICY